MNQGNITFRFRQFALTDRRCGMKIGTDAVVAGVLADMAAPEGRVADIGAGCGIISLMIAQRFPSATVDAVEIDAGAFLDLKENVDNSSFKSRLNPVEGDFNLLTGPYDLIVSNPPYYNNGEVAPDASRAIARHARGLSGFSLLDFAVSKLSAEGKLAMIIPSVIAEEVEAEAIFKRLYLSRRVDVATSRRRGITRSFLEFVRSASVIPSKSTLEVNSDEWAELTREFYIKQ